MITFFRKIRKSLVEGKKTSKYVKYALGEIILVVIGILIALQINNANELNNKKKLEIALLKELKKEIRTNKLLLEDSQKTHKWHDSVSTQILSGNYKKTAEEMLRLSVVVTFYRTTDFVNGTVDAILSEYGPSIITNDSIRDYVTSWRDMENDIIENEKIEENLMVNHMFFTIGKFINYKDVVSISQNLKNKEPIEVDKIGLHQHLEKLMENKEFASVVYAKFFNDRGFDSDISPVLQKMNTVLKLIDKELSHD